MNQFFLYPFKYKEKDGNGAMKDVTATVLFCESNLGLRANLSAEIKQYYEQHEQTDRLFVIGAKDIAADLVTAFDTNKDDTYRYIPKSNHDNLIINTFIFSFDEKGTLSLAFTPSSSQRIPDGIFNEGLLTIFKTRGGLIESNEGHHYVFPSGKHCSKFLRTGNILLHSAEIFFIAFTLLPHFNLERHANIFCDTSSINSLAFALQELKRRILQHTGVKYNMVPVDSFSSYEGLVKGYGKRLEQSLILISASTSANILQRINKTHPILHKEDMKILFYLGPEDGYNENKAQILCNLTKYDQHSTGIDIYSTYQAADCELCARGSYPAKINGDVFLPENPKIELLSITGKDVPIGLSDFMEQFQSEKGNQEHFIKVNYKENTDPELKYDIYMDVFHVISAIKSGTIRYKQFQEKLDDYIHQYIPSNVRYFVCLPDEGSKVMAEYILSKIQANYKATHVPKILTFDQINQISKTDQGSIVVIASCVSKGKNLLYLSRSFRQHDKLKLVYFIGISRMTNEQIQGFLKSNLRYGKYGGETYSYHVIENFNCTNEVKNTAWARERKFMKEFQEYIDEKFDDSKFYDAIQKRIEILENSVSKTQKGLANELFFPSIYDGKPLELRKNYAFLKYTDYHGNVSQADVYFTVNSIIHKLRNNKTVPKLQQTEYVRILIDPLNFNRFNDGIIQASFLRSCNVDELCYHIDHTASLEIMGIIETLIKYQNSEQGEALLEFLYALACRQMTMKNEHLYSICKLAGSQVNNDWVKYLAEYIEATVLDDYNKHLSQKQQIIELKEEIRQLKGKNKTIQVAEAAVSQDSFQAESPSGN